MALWVSLISAAVALISVVVSSHNAARVARLQHALELQRYDKGKADDDEEIASRCCKQPSTSSHGSTTSRPSASSTDTTRVVILRSGSTHGTARCLDSVSTSGAP